MGNERNGRSPELPPPPPSVSILFTQEPLMPSAPPTGDAVPVPGGGQRPCRIPGIWARSQKKPSWGDVAAMPKMAGLAYEDRTRSVSPPALPWNLLWLEEIVDKKKQEQDDYQPPEHYYKSV